MTAKRRLGVPTRCAPPAHPSRSYPGSVSHPAAPQGLPASPSLQTHDNWHRATLPLIQRYKSHHHPATLPLITQGTDTHEHLHRLLHIVFLLRFICLCHQQAACIRRFPAISQAKELRSMLILIYGVHIASALLLKFVLSAGNHTQ